MRVVAKPTQTPGAVVGSCRAARWGAPTCAMALTVAMLTLADCDDSEFPLVGGLAREAELWARSFRSRRWAASLRSSAVRLSMPAADSFTKGRQSPVGA